MKEHLKSLLYMCIAGVLFWLFLPERYAINAPIKLANSIADEEILSWLKVANNFSISIYADNLTGVRALAITSNGDLIASRPRTGELTLIHADADRDGRTDGTKLLLQGLDHPHGVALHKGWLYIAETSAVLRVKYDAKQRKFIGTPRYIIRDSFPGGGNHWVRSVKVGPDEKLYVSVGSSCNACIEQSEKRGTILQFDLDGKNEIIYAKGLRNTTGFDWQPSSKLMFGLDIGRDYLGDNTPSEELNQLSIGQHYGWPYKYGHNISDSDFTNSLANTAAMTPPVHQMTAHSTPLSLLFLQNHKTLSDTALVTLHGSWNRSKKSGYKVISLSFNSDASITQKDFITGFETNGAVIGRPVDLVEGKDGHIFLSDDYSGKIYKITSTVKNP